MIAQMQCVEGSCDYIEWSHIWQEDELGMTWRRPMLVDGYRSDRRNFRMLPPRNWLAL